MDMKAKYTALSRGTCPENIQIVGEYNQENCIDEKNRQKIILYAKTDAEKGCESNLTVDTVNVLLNKHTVRLKA